MMFLPKMVVYIRVQWNSTCSSGKFLDTNGGLQTDTSCRPIRVLQHKQQWSQQSNSGKLYDAYSDADIGKDHE